ncbi:MAG: DUF4296 domain-containing protein, partial [Gracilimonas sp.]
MKFTNISFFLPGSISLVLASILMSGCMGPEETPKPKNLIDQENYIDLLVEMQYIKTYRDAYPDSVSADSLKNIIYKKYVITESQFLASHEYYQKQVREQLVRVDEVIRRIENEEQNIQTHIDSVKAIQ